MDDFLSSALKETLAEALASFARKLYTAEEFPVLLWASEVGAYLGRDDWMPRDKALARVWKRSNEGQYLAALAAWRAPAASFPDICTTADMDAFRKTAAPGELAKLYKAKGISSEEGVAAMFADSIQQPVVLRHAMVEWQSGGVAKAVPNKRPPGAIVAPGPFTITGQVDGWLQQAPYAGVIVEIKVRMGRIPATVPEKDLMQVQTYMHINNAEECIYVQNVFGTQEMHTQHFCRDSAYWETIILPGLRKFVCDVRCLLRGDEEDTELRNRVFAAATAAAVTAATTAAIALPASAVVPATAAATAVPATATAVLATAAAVPATAAAVPATAASAATAVPTTVKKSKGPPPPPFSKPKGLSKRSYVQWTANGAEITPLPAATTAESHSKKRLVKPVAAATHIVSETGEHSGVRTRQLKRSKQQPPPGIRTRSGRVMHHRSK